ncbi:MAG: bifunctional 4-hydroxy-3-methylbut-2-enyl diphosphate reductase/30S ribosomal protein S1 [Peptococcaceae bacterium]|jgi:4-hydroxy-3-methylbut-2-enyl diphosphate reductase|nr:bifunctional 4-hydroxy-3-methylbut-2-enyl diphosphate reductase/30S ribosomal protein S1 [Peptococcaceae bacterium]
MKVLRAARSGFCPGVKRAMELARQSIGKGDGPVWCLGPLIHNQRVMEGLYRAGVREADTLAGIDAGTVIVRTHGAGPWVFEEAARRGLAVADATCPFVRRAQETARKLSGEGLPVIVVGDRDHPEVQGIAGWVPGRVLVVRDEQEVRDLEFLPEEAGLLAQTTQPRANLEAVAACLRDRGCRLKLVDTICHATRERQEFAQALARQVEVMVVVGGANSANTGRLAAICRGAGARAYLVESAADLDPAWFAGIEKAGLTAGASTPDWIIEEVEQRMSEFETVTGADEEIMGAGQAAGTEAEAPAEAPAEAEEQMEEVEFKALRHGEITRGVVVAVGPDEVFVDVGAKSEGIVPLRELSCCEISSPRDIVKVGDEIDVFVLKTEDNEGRVVLSKEKADAEKAWGHLEKALQSGEPVPGVVREVVKGGLLVDVGVRAFLPASLVERGYVDDLSRYLGAEIASRIIEMNRGRRKVILSRKAVLEVEYARTRAELMEKVADGQVVRGVVRRLTQFGAFVDIGGIDGLLHISEMAWHRVGHPSEVVKVGDELDVMVLKVDRVAEKVSLGLKQVLANPWNDVIEKYPVGTVLPARVVRLAPFGAFVQLEPGVEGLVHISHLADRHVARPEDVVSEGDTVQVKVLSVDQPEKRIRLSIREVASVERKARAAEAPAPTEGSAGPDTNVTLGDVFGSMFQEKREDPGADDDWH